MGHSACQKSFPQSRYYTVIDYKYCKVWKRKDNLKETMEQYQVCIENQQHLNKFQKMWEVRTHQQKVVNFYYFNHHSSQQLCSLIQNASILTQRIPYRLSQFRNIPYQEIISIMRLSLQAFKLLYIEYGLFKVKSTMVGINCEKKLKVWHHTDFSNPQPENSNCKSLQEMIRSTIYSIQINADQPFNYVKFSEFLDINKDRFSYTFEQILQVLLTYRQMNKIPFNQSLSQIQFYIRKAQGEDQDSFNTYNKTNFSKKARLNQKSPQRVLLSSQGFSPDYDNALFLQNSQSYNNFFPNLNQSSKTFKRNPSINIYTHKEVNHMLESQKELSNYLILREKSLKSPYIPISHTQSKLFQTSNQHLIQNLKHNFSIQPQLNRKSTIYKNNQVFFRPIVNKEINKIESHQVCRNDFKSLQKRQSKPYNYFENRMIQRNNERIVWGDQRYMNGIDKNAKFEISTIRSSSLNNSKSKQSSFIFL